jgi:hypothetical protein
MKGSAKSHGLSALLAAALSMGGCAGQQYMGVSLKPGGADPAVQALAVKAQGGDKQAQYELGRWFEDSTDADGLKKAKRLYRQAASDSGGSRLLLVPSSSGLTTSVVGMGPKIDGNEAAQARLRQFTLAQKMEQDHVQSEIGGMASRAEKSKGVNMIDNLIKLSNIPAGTMKVLDVSEIFGVKLKKIGSGHSIDFYTNDPNNDNLEIIIFSLPTNEFGLSLSGLQIQQEKTERLTDFLLQNNWTHKTEIKHPFIFDSFYKKNKKISLKHTMLDLLEIGMSGLNVEGDEYVEGDE